MTTPLPGSLAIYDALVERHVQAVCRYAAATWEPEAEYWYREAQVAERMLGYCPEHWARVEAIRVVEGAGH